jgi:hypothetical protein
MLIHAFWRIENTFHDAFSVRSSLDQTLEQMRKTFEVNKQQVAAALIKQFQIKAPLMIPP